MRAKYLIFQLLIILSEGKILKGGGIIPTRRFTDNNSPSSTISTSMGHNRIMEGNRVL